MARPAFIVEGLTERRAIERICPGIPVRLINCNGHHVSMQTIAKFVAVQIRSFNNRYYPILIILDREQRTKTCEELVNELRLELENMGYHGQFRIGMADRTIENWILADKGLLSHEYGVNVADQSFEGVNGKGRLKGLLPNGVFYHEATIGADLLASIDPIVARKNSPSFDRFCSAIDFDCGWL